MTDSLRTDSLRDFIGRMRPALPVLEEIDRQGGIEVVRVDGVAQARLHSDRLGPAARSLLATAMRGGPSMLIDTVLTIRLVAGGPRVLRLDFDRADALERVEPRLTVAEVRLPFPTTVVEMPAAWATRHTVAAGGRTTVPRWVVLHMVEEAEALWYSVYVGEGVSVAGAVNARDGATVADDLGEPRHDISAPGYSYTAEESDAVRAAVRVAVNACVLMAGLGRVDARPDNPSHLARLQRHVAAARKRGTGVESAERELRLVPLVASWDDEIVVAARATQHRGNDPGDPAGRRNAPHWRRGHMRMQAHGEGLGLRRLVFIRPVLVNGHLVAGRPEPGPRVYRLEGES